jgi:hypothetical protein
MIVSVTGFQLPVNAEQDARGFFDLTTENWKLTSVPPSTTQSPARLSAGLIRP